MEVKKPKLSFIEAGHPGAGSKETKSPRFKVVTPQTNKMLRVYTFLQLPL